MVGMLFVIVALIVLFTGMGSIMLIGTKLRQDHEARIVGSPDTETVKRLAEALEMLQGQVDDLAERLDFTERLLAAPKDAAPKDAAPKEGSDRRARPDPRD